MNEKILLIDDHTLFRAGLEDLLKRRGIEVIEAVGSGDEGIKKVAELKPDIVLLDMRMPQMDGLMVLRQLRKNHPGLKVVMLTTSGEDRDIQASYAHGASAYVVKPLDFGQFQEAVQTITDFGARLNRHPRFG